eukprot:5749646-Pleurochrysis_carterae.AAC.2
MRLQGDVSATLRAVEPSKKRTPRAGVRGAKEPFAPALSALTSDRSVADWSPVNDKVMLAPLVFDGKEPPPPNSIDQ